jgi:predicted esterase YcpF (UPF0227 family)
LFYFNGFNSAIPADWSDNEKIVAVADYARRRGFHFVPRSVNYRRAAEESAAILRELGVSLRSGSPAPEPSGREGADNGHIIFAGSSMGGWFARIMQLMLAQARPKAAVEVLAFNPAFDLRLHGDVLLGPQVNHVTLEEYEWTEADGERLAGLERAVNYDAPLPFYVYVDKGDEVIGWHYSAARHGPIARFVAFEGGSHTFEHAPEALQDFDACRQQ